MKLTTTVTHEIDFTVSYFEHAEGGMNSDTFGKTVNDLSSAVRLLELAKVQHPENDWVIVADVSTQVGGKSA
jgi:hypothetical protein